MVFEEIDVYEILILLVMNKIDMLEDFELCIDWDEENKLNCVWFFVQIGVGILQFFQVLMEWFFGEVVQYILCLLLQEGCLRSCFYQFQVIEKEWMEEDGSVSL